MNDEQTQNAGQGGNSAESPKGAGVRFPPPLIFLLCLFTGIGLRKWMPVELGISTPWNFAGLLLVLAGFAIIASTAIAFRRAHTAIEPWKPTTSLVYGGCYKFSRNPIYLSFCLCLIGLGITANSVWITLAALPCGIAIYWIAIVREEAYLEQKFGEDYLQYKRRVRRWL